MSSTITRMLSGIAHHVGLTLPSCPEKMKKSEIALVAWVNHVSRKAAPIAPLIYTIYQLPIQIRSVVLIACRVQPSDFTSSSRFSNRQQKLLRYWIPLFDSLNGKQYGSQRLSDFLQDYIQFFQSPILCGFISMIIRFLPYDDYGSSEEVRAKTLEKEILAATRILHPTSLNYTCIFERRIPGELNPPWMDGMANPNPSVCSSTNSSLNRAANLATKKILVPKVSRKTFCVDGSYLEPFADHTESGEIATILDVERVYCRTGTRIGGNTEMRSAWKGNQLKPRIYYARGPRHHFASCHIQAIFNIFVDCLLATHRRSRFNLFELDELTEDMILMIYDYSSFTSSLHEIRNFTAHLADFCRGRLVKVMDGYLGVIEKDLGDILDDYNQECNISADFDASRLLGITDLVLSHNTGMLGLPGNISSCTLLHGIHLCIILSSLKRGKVIGDDALAEFEKEDIPREFLVDAIQKLGEIAEEKMEWWYEDSLDDPQDRWHYEKRPIGRLSTRIFRGRLVIWPSIDKLFGILNPFHVHLPESNLTRIASAIKQLLHFRDQISMYDISPEEEVLITETIRHFYKENSLWEFGRGYVGELEIDGESTDVVIPPCGRRFFSESTLDQIRGSLNSVIRVPLSEPSLLQTPLELTVGSRFIAKPSGLLSYWKKMGFLLSKREEEIRMIEDCDDLTLVQFAHGTLSFMYMYTVCDILPKWSKDLIISSLPHVPHEYDERSHIAGSRDEIGTYDSDM